MMCLSKRKRKEVWDIWNIVCKGEYRMKKVGGEEQGLGRMGFGKLW